MEDIYFKEKNKNLPGAGCFKTTTLASDDVKCSFIWLLQLLHKHFCSWKCDAVHPEIEKLKEKMVNVHFKPNFGVQVKCLRPNFFFNKSVSHPSFIWLYSLQYSFIHLLLFFFCLPKWGAAVGPVAGGVATASCRPKLQSWRLCDFPRNNIRQMTIISSKDNGG